MPREDVALHEDDGEDGMFFEDEDVPYEDGAFHEDESVYMEKRMEDNGDTQTNEGTDMLQRRQ